MPDERELFEQLIRSELLPLFPQAEVSQTPPKHSHINAAYLTDHGRSAIRLQISIESDFAFLIRRSQGFDDVEKTIIEVFVHQYSQILPHVNEDFGKGLKKSQMDLVVARAVARAVGQPTASKVLRRLFTTFQQWAQETYEGHHIAAAFGVDEVATPDAETLSIKDYVNLNLAKVVGDGCNSFVKVSSNGRILGHEQLASVHANDSTFAPFAFVPMAQWAQQKKIAVALNRGGEILVFSNGVLSFARRRGRWMYFGHGSTVKQMAPNGPRDYLQALRLAAYCSSLDISFARVGGGIGLVERGKEIVGENLPVKPRDLLSRLETNKTKALAALITGRKYQDLGRPLRQEIGGIDGAVVLKSDGTFITAGAVLAVSVSSDEGARKTAAKTLGKFGLGIKVSSDGKIEAFTGEPAADQKPLFEIG